MRKLKLKPGFYFHDAVSQGRSSGSVDFLGGDGELDVVCKAVELKSKGPKVRMKRRGQRTEPWGTPPERVVVGDLQVLMLINWCLMVR